MTPLIVHICGHCAHHATSSASLHTDRSRRRHRIMSAEPFSGVSWFGGVL